jgi:hypothetical protein
MCIVLNLMHYIADIIYFECSIILAMPINGGREVGYGWVLDMGMYLMT